MTRTVQIVAAMAAVIAATVVLAASSTAGAVEVKVGLARNRDGAEITAPSLAKYGAVPEYRLRHGYEAMWHVVLQICNLAEHQLQERQLAPVPTAEPTITGFAAQAVRFNAARHPLIPLMQHYGLGYPPSLEDFSEVETVFFAPPRIVKVQGGVYVEEIWADFLGEASCRIGVSNGS